MKPPNSSLGNNSRPGRSPSSRSATSIPDLRFKARDSVPPQPPAPAIPKSGMIPATAWNDAGLPAQAKGVKTPK